MGYLAIVSISREDVVLLPAMQPEAIKEALTANMVSSHEAELPSLIILRRTLHIY